MSDTTDRNIILVIVVVLIFFLVFIKGSIKLKNDWINIKCNPIRLFLNSINDDPAESTATFSNCVNDFNTHKKYKHKNKNN